jgi:2-polyprenyl-3-methyl-5-hydroxy-6-metoxy-1,4-benzoquinol methylase
MMSAEPQTESRPRGCELCGSTDMRKLYTARDRLRNSDEAFIIARCGGCGVWRTLPEMSASELARFYPNDYWGEDHQPSQKWIQASQAEKTAFLRRCGLKGGRILDVGCGSGLFLRALDAGRWDRYGVEIGEVAAKAAARALGEGRIITGTLAGARLAEASFDVVTLWSSLEHMNEPRASLFAARRILRPGGTLIVQVPNAASYQARAFGGDWFALDAPRHRYHFHKKTLGRLLSQTGFEVYAATTFSRAHNAHALRQSLKTRLYRNRASGRLLFLLAIPFIKPFDRLMTALSEGATLTVAARAA